MPFSSMDSATARALRCSGAQAKCGGRDEAVLGNDRLNVLEDGLEALALHRLAAHNLASERMLSTISGHLL